MEENKKTELEEQTEQISGEEKTEHTEEAETDTKNQNADSEQKPRPAGNFGLMLLAGVYLVYTGYQLCRDVLTGVEGASVGFLAAGVAFLVIGGVILYKSCKNQWLRKQAKKAQEAKEMELDPQPEEPETPRRMTIAERAKLTETLAEREADEAVSEEADSEKNKEKAE